MPSVYPSLVFHRELTISELTSKEAVYPSDNQTRAGNVGVP